MKKGSDIAVTFPGLYLVHHNLPGKEVERHGHEQHLLFLPLQGEIEVATDAATIKAGPGRMVYLPPGTQHAFRSSTAQGERLIALLDPKAWKRAGAAARELGLIATSQLVKEILFHLLLHPATKHATALIQTLVLALDESLEASCHLLDVAHVDAKVRDARVKKVLAYFQERLGESVSMTAAARAAGLSQRSMTRLFASELGLSPKQVLSQYRVDHARALLVSGKATVTEAALDVGYQSLPQFIAVFQKLTGQLPSEVLRMGAASRA